MRAALACILLLSAQAPDAGPADAGAPAAPTGLAVPFEKYTLGNGLEVILHADPRLPVVAVSVWYHVGALHETPGKSGFAHLFEHLMFQGTPHTGDDSHFRFLEAAGASNVNGTTDFDRTNYYEVVPKNELELALWLESDRMGWLMEGVTQAKLDEQRGVVKNERRQAVENQPYGLADEKLWQSIFPPEHPYWGNVIGSMKDLDAASLDDVGRFYDLYYAPSNATLALAGDFDPAEAKKLVEKYFGTLPAWSKPPPAAPPTPSLASEVRVVHDERVATLPKVALAWFSPPAYAQGDAELHVLARILADGNASRLQQALLFNAPIAERVTARQASAQSASVFLIEVVVRDGVAPNDALEAVSSQLAVLPDLPPSPEEIARAVAGIEREMLFGLVEPLGRAEMLQTYNHYKGTPDYLAQDLARFRAVTPESIVATMTAHLAPERRGVLVAARAPAAASPVDGGPAGDGGAQ